MTEHGSDISGDATPAAPPQAAPMPGEATPEAPPPPPQPWAGAPRPGGGAAATPSSFLHRPGTALAVYVIGLVILIAAVWWLVDTREPTAEATTTETRLAALDQRVAALEARPPTNLAPLENRIAALEHRPAPRSDAPGASPEQVTALADRLDSLERAVQSLGQNTPPPAPAPADPALADRIAGLEQRIAALDAHEQQDATRLGTATQQAERNADAAGQRAARLARLQQAAQALAAGTPLGMIDGAPAALTRYATAAPPTLATLRRDFAVTAAAIRKADSAGAPQGDFWQRARARLGRLVTVTEGDQVLLGDSADTVLARARAALDAGDLAAATAELESFQGEAATAASPWLAQAHALLAARAVLASMLGATAQ